MASAREAVQKLSDGPREQVRQYLQATAPNPNPSPWINTPTDQPIRISEGSTEWEYPLQEDGTVSFPLSLLFDTVRAASAQPPREAAQPPGRYITKYDFVVDLGEDAGSSEFLLTVHLGFREEDKEVVCVGIDLRSFAVFPDPTGPVGLPLQHLTAARLRSLRLGDYAEQAINSCRMSLRAIADDPESPIDDAGRSEVAGLAGSGRQRGRPPALTDGELVEFVVKPYRGGGRQKTEQVRQALQASGLLAPLSRGGQVEIQQARKQIDRARSRGLLPRRGRKEQS